MKKLALACLAMLMACSSGNGSSSSQQPGNQSPSPFIAGFNPPASPPDGYTRYILPVIKDIAPGTDKTWCVYLSGPATDTVDVIDMSGYQSKGGHHIVLYGTQSPGDVGVVKDCNDSSMTSARILGGIGGEAVTGITQQLPQGTVLRLPKGYSILANVHFVNSSPKTIDGQGVIDMKTAPADPSKSVASLFTNVGLTFQLPANKGSTHDATCTIKKDLQILLFGNHMHEMGTSVTSTVKHPDGTTEVLRDDREWQQNEVFNPTFTVYKKEAPMTFKAGDVVTTHCEWQNTTPDVVRFPTEMCVGIGIYTGQDEIDCVDGQWPTGN